MLTRIKKYNKRWSKIKNKSNKIKEKKDKTKPQLIKKSTEVLMYAHLRKKKMLLNRHALVA